MLEIDIYSDILSVAAHFVDERLERLVERYGDQLKVNYHWVSLLSDTDSPDKRNSVVDYYQHIEQLKNVSSYIQFNDSIWLNKIRTSSSGAHLFLKAVQLLEESRGNPSYSIVHSLANRYRRVYFEDGEDISNFLVLEKVLDELSIDKASVNEFIRNSKALNALIDDEKACHKIHSHEVLPLLSFQRGNYKLYGDVSFKVIENMVENLIHLTKERAA